MGARNAQTVRLLQAAVDTLTYVVDVLDNHLDIEHLARAFERFERGVVKEFLDEVHGLEESAIGIDEGDLDPDDREPEDEREQEGERSEPPF